MDSVERNFYQKLGEIIQKKRNEADLNQSALALKVGIKRTSLTNIESGNQTVHAYVLYRIAVALNLSVADLLPDIEDVSPDLASLLNGQKILTDSGETSGLKQEEKDIVLKMIQKQKQMSQEGKNSYGETK